MPINVVETMSVFIFMLYTNLGLIPFQCIFKLSLFTFRHIKNHELTQICLKRAIVKGVAQLRDILHSNVSL
jgi:hypothetical protein